MLSPKGLFLEAISEKSDHIVKIYDDRPRGSQLVRVTATLQPVSKSLKPFSRKKPNKKNNRRR